MSNIGARLDRLPVSKFHYKLIGIVCVGTFFDAFDLYILSGIIAVMVKQGFANTAMVANLISINFLGLFLGALTSGITGDRYGRRTMFVWNLLIFSIASILCALSPNFLLLMVFRFIAAFGLGGETATAWTIIGEFIPPTKRGTWGSIAFLIINLAMPISFLLGMLILPIEYGWRLMFLIAGIPALFAYFIRRAMPESPRWYEVTGRYEEADRLVTKIEAEIEQQTKQKLPPVTGTITENEKKQPFWFLFSKRLLGRSILAILITVVIQVTGYGFSSWVPTVFVQKGLSIVKSLSFSGAMMSGSPVGALIGILIGDRLSRKWGIVVISILGAVASYAYAMSSSNVRILVLGFILTAMISALSSISFTTYIPEQFPTAVRAGANGLASSLGRLAVVGMPYMVLVIMGVYGFSGVLITFSGMLLFLSLLVAIIGNETRNKSLEDINANISKKMSV